MGNFDNFKVSGVFWSFLSLMGYFGYFLSFGGISIIFQKFRIYVVYLNFRWVLVGLSIN